MEDGPPLLNLFYQNFVGQIQLIYDSYTIMTSARAEYNRV